MTGSEEARIPTSFTQARTNFLAGADTPRNLLERCLERIAERESSVHAFVVMNEHARAAADAATERYRAGQLLSIVDGCPIGIKDIMDTHDMPTQMGSPAFKGWQPRHDAACVQALRAGGAVLVGKTVTTALACGATNVTTNPHDAARTPGGSSSGSAAAIGAGMLPVALGTQSQGSILRPAAYCGVVGFKPTFGALPMQGVHPITATHDHLGVLASTLDDAWRVASHLSITHGSPGHPYLNGASAEAPRPKKPRRLIRLHMRAWESEVDQATRETFESFIDYVKGAGVEIVDRTSNGDVRDFEAALDDGFVQRSIDITTYEMKWPYLQYVEKYGDMIEQRIHDRMARARHMTHHEYATLLVDKQVMRERARKVMAGTDGIVTLAASGPAPVGRENTGSRTYLVYATFLGIPAFSLPLLTVDGMPLGVQLIGRANTDGQLAATAGWLTNKLQQGLSKRGS